MMQTSSFIMVRVKAMNVYYVTMFKWVKSIQ